MKSLNEKPASGIIKLDLQEGYTRLFSTKDGNAAKFRSGCVVLKEKKSIGEHNTGETEEILIILKGRGELLIDRSERLTFEKDTALYVPPNTIHDVKNRGHGPLKYVFIATEI